MRMLTYIFHEVEVIPPNVVILHVADALDIRRKNRIP